MPVAQLLSQFFDTLRSQIHFLVEFKARDLPKRVMTASYLAVMLLIYSGPEIAWIFFTAILFVEFARRRMFRRLPANPHEISDRQVAGVLFLDVTATTAYCVPALGLIASNTVTGMLLGLLWLSAVTIHNVAGLALIKVWCWAALLPIMSVNGAAVWGIAQRDFASSVPSDFLVLGLGSLIYAGNMVEVTFRQRQNRDAFSAAQTAARDRLQRLEYLARHDALTGLLNRRAFDEVASDAVQFGCSTGVLLLDLDGFKPINDTYGHAAGDAVLTALAKRFAELAEPHPVARLGGDEFAAVIPDADPSLLNDLIEKLHAAAATPVEVDGHALVVGVSIGRAIQSGPNQTVQALCHEADLEMYRVKDTRKRRLADTA